MYGTRERLVSIAHYSDVRFPLQPFGPASWTLYLGFSRPLELSSFQQSCGFLFHHNPCFTAKNWEKRGDLGTEAVPQLPSGQCWGLMTSSILDILGLPSGVCFAPFCAEGGGDRLPLFHWSLWDLLCYLWNMMWYNNRMSKAGMIEE